MTTVGYGNGSPQTFGGRLMVFTAGFFSILLFAVVLGNAGKIVTNITDDWLSRLPRLSLLTHDWVICLFWGGCYYGWMFVVAFVTVRWKRERVGVDLAWDDAYWFAFITTTTVGLGDFYLEHEVLLRRDLIAFSLMILVGFIFLANFLVKLTDLLKDCFPWMAANNYQDRLNHTVLLWGKSKRHLSGTGASSSSQQPPRQQKDVEKSSSLATAAAGEQEDNGQKGDHAATKGAVGTKIDPSL
jgi:Ion channel